MIPDWLVYLLCFAAGELSVVLWLNFRCSRRGRDRR